jgi:hypothetical protein
MNNLINQRNILIGIFITICIYVITYYSTNRLPVLPFTQINNPPVVHNSDCTDDGWISSSLYNELQSYIISRDRILQDIPKPIAIKDGIVQTMPLNYDYIQFVNHTITTINYPYSKWECANTSSADIVKTGEYCILTNIYYNSVLDEYYFYQDTSQTNKPKRNIFIAPNFAANVTIIEDSTFFKEKFNLASILTRPILVGSPYDDNYAHGFLEGCGPRFWVLAECQYHASYINPSKIQTYITSEQLKNHPPNWDFYKRRSDGTYEATRKWEHIIQSMQSIYPLLTYKSFNDTNVMFKYLIFPGQKLSRSASWGYTYTSRKFRSYPFPTQHYRRAYLAFSEWILNNFHLPSKFELTKIQKEVQLKQSSESIPICNGTCTIEQSIENSTDEYTGEWIVVLNRAGRGKREITNADELVQGLLKTFPDHSNPHLRVWPKQFNFDDNLYESARMGRSIRLLIGVHGAGLSNTLFMRPGAILYEINPYGCRDLSFNFRRWAEVFNLQHALWVPSYGENGNEDDQCERDGRITLNVKEIIDEVKNMLKNENYYRTGYIKRALDIMTDLSIVDYPPKGYENLFS